MLDLLTSMPLCLTKESRAKWVDQKGMELEKGTCFSVESNENTFFVAEWVHMESLLVL